MDKRAIWNGLKTQANNGLDVLQEQAHNRLDEVFLVLAKVLDDVSEEVESRLDAEDGGGVDETAPATEAKVAPDVEVMRQDLATNRGHVWPNSPYSQYDAGVIKTLWEHLPEQDKTYVKRSPGSPL